MHVIRALARDGCRRPKPLEHVTCARQVVLTGNIRSSRPVGFEKQGVGFASHCGRRGQASGPAASDSITSQRCRLVSLPY